MLVSVQASPKTLPFLPPGEPAHGDHNDYLDEPLGDQHGRVQSLDRRCRNRLRGRREIPPTYSSRQDERTPAEEFDAYVNARDSGNPCFDVRPLICRIGICGLGAPSVWIADTTSTVSPTNIMESSLN